MEILGILKITEPYWWWVLVPKNKLTIYYLHNWCSVPGDVGAVGMGLGSDISFFSLAGGVYFKGSGGINFLNTSRANLGGWRPRP